MSSGWRRRKLWALRPCQTWGSQRRALPHSPCLPPWLWRLLIVARIALRAWANDDNCDSGYWRHVRATVTRGLDGEQPTAAEIARLHDEQTELDDISETVGCIPGRFVLSLWQLAYSDIEERAYHLERGFGRYFFSMDWIRRVDGWPIASAIAMLQSSVQQDPEGTHPPNVCHQSGGSKTYVASEAELALGASLSNASSPHMFDGIPAAMARSTQFLLEADRTTTCPFAISVALWAIAASMLFAAVGDGQGTSVRSESAADEAWRIVHQGESSLKSLGVAEIRFIDLLTTPWPLWALGAHLERAAWIASHEQRLQAKEESTTKGIPAVPATPVDPLQPRCEPSNRSVLTESLRGQRVEAVVVFGRRDRVEILHRYLLRNARANGGVLDGVMFVVFWAMQEDLEYLHKIVADHAPYYSMPPVTGRRLAKMYSVCTDPDTIYIKLDDDIVFLSDEAIPEMVLERSRDRCTFVSANVVNHAILSSLHQDIGAIRSFFPFEPENEESAGTQASPMPKRFRPWIRADNSPPMAAIVRQAQSTCVWKMWECAAWMHESLLSRVEDGTTCAYDFGWHDFHAHGHGSYRGDRFVPLPYTRWSINMIAFKSADLREASLDDLAEDDESELSYMVPHRTHGRGCAVGKALVAHYSYSRQDDGLMENTNLLERYRNLSLTLA